MAADIKPSQISLPEVRLVVKSMVSPLPTAGMQLLAMEHPTFEIYLKAWDLREVGSRYNPHEEATASQVSSSWFGAYLEHPVLRGLIQLHQAVLTYGCQTNI